MIFPILRSTNHRYGSIFCSIREINILAERQLVPAFFLSASCFECEFSVSGESMVDRFRHSVLRVFGKKKKKNFPNSVPVVSRLWSAWAERLMVEA